MNKDTLYNMFEYKDGVLYRRYRMGRMPAGSVAGALDNRGYISVHINHKKYKAHRLIYIMFFGEAPEFIDHINGIRTDNRIENLRPATALENQLNRKISKKNTSGIKGVCWRPKENKWQVRIKVNGVNKSLGCYNDLNQASKVIQEARMKYHKEFARHR